MGSDGDSNAGREVEPDLLRFFFFQIVLINNVFMLPEIFPRHDTNTQKSPETFVGLYNMTRSQKAD